jgi:hypothetical protein
VTDRGLVEAALAEKSDRAVFRRVFGGEEGNSALVWILNECGYFSQDSRIIDPVLIGLCNRILGKLGINHAGNLFADTAARTGAANDRDLDAIIGEGENDE